MALVGYTDPGHFSRDFRQLHGVTPAALRASGRVTPLHKVDAAVVAGSAGDHRTVHLPGGRADRGQ